MTLPGPSARTALRTAVLDWYEGHARDLPWRHPETSAWGVLEVTSEKRTLTASVIGQSEYMFPEQTLS